MAAAKSRTTHYPHAGKMVSAEATLKQFAEKHRDLISNADSLPQPLRAIAEFVKKEIGAANG